MNLFPKARPVRIKLSVGGEEHSSLDSLQRCFDVEEVLKLYENGGLKNWLRQIHKEDLLEAMKDIDEKNNIVEKYEQCIKIFFDRNSSEYTLETFLIDWCDSSPYNFKSLLNKIKKFSISDYSLPISTAKKLMERAKKVNDKDTCVIISEHFYVRLNSVFYQLRDLYLKIKPTDSALEIGETKRDNKEYLINEILYSTLLNRIYTEWDYKGIRSTDLSEILNKLCEHIISTNILECHNDELKKVVNNILLEIKKDIPKYTLKKEDLECAEAFVKKVRSFSSYIDAGNFRVTDNTYSASVLFIGLDPYSISIPFNWFLVIDIRNKFQQDFSTNVGFKSGTGRSVIRPNTLSELLDGLFKLFIRVYLCNCSLRNLRVSTYKSRLEFNFLNSFLDSSGGFSKLNFLSKNIYETISPELDNSVSGLFKTILQSALFIGAMSAVGSGKPTQKKYLEELSEQGYRLASLYLGSVQPKTVLEREFLNLNDVEKMRFVAEHILEI